jgi:hypothetical protein
LGFFSPGPESVCRAHLVDSTTTNKILGPGSLARHPGSHVAQLVLLKTRGVPSAEATSTV